MSASLDNINVTSLIGRVEVWVGNEIIDRYDSNFIKAWDELTKNKHDITTILRSDTDTDVNTDVDDISDDNPNKKHK